ncbi:glycosyltransferase family 4 protein [Niastella caeni]|uniref:Glycosyltransferase family 4 protein n=1 Tax=Niastella caeni TaxID=2569763 RepID=A0A4S8HV28_9BACT|nr:glycosyltransferase family 4 protein [Niastella caeni]THU39463.1 glycosyltransferase family 4 protein [Niastella caeni]
MTYKEAKRKFFIERIGMFPFVLLGKICGHIFPLKTSHNIFLFFPNTDIGGAPRVNIDITACVKDQRPLIIFSKKPQNGLFKDKYIMEGVRTLDLHRLIDNKLFHFVNFFYRGLLATWINKQKGATVLGGESLFFYKVIPHLSKEIKCVEVCHLATWLPYSIGFIDRITTRLFSTERLKEQVAEQYRENKLPEHYFKKLCFIDNAIEIPEYLQTDNNNLEVYFIGRGAPQKRVHLVAAIAEKINSKQLPVKFNFVGDVDNVIDPSNYPYCKFYGNVKDDAQMRKIYEQADVLILTSAYEGLPIVVMEMMARGKPIISTAVNGIPNYIHHRENGLLIQATDEEEIVAEGCQYVEELLNNKPMRVSFGKRGRVIAIERFSKEEFCKSYRQVLQLA